MRGIYVHIPFCDGKCPYCDFYSVDPSKRLVEDYTDALIKDMRRFGGVESDTLYFGGGTPILLGAENLARIIAAARELFALRDAEITVESNPSFELRGSLETLAAAGVNRLSLGMQSAVEKELRALGRRHSPLAVQNSVKDAKLAGIENISVDWMIGIENQTDETLVTTADFIASLDISHVSAYMLKIEPGTPFFERRESLKIADEDSSARMYLEMCSLLEARGFSQYEISNFSKNGSYSRHNLKYWNCEEYLGFGASAHSFFEGKRFYYPRSVADYIKGCQPIPDGAGGDFEEYVMLMLRLSQGLTEAGCSSRFGAGIPEKMRKKALFLEKKGLCRVDENSISLTKNGFLLSNSVIFELMDF